MPRSRPSAGGAAPAAGRKARGSEGARARPGAGGGAGARRAAGAAGWARPRRRALERGRPGSLSGLEKKTNRRCMNTALRLGLRACSRNACAPPSAGPFLLSLH